MSVVDDLKAAREIVARGWLKSKSLLEDSDGNTSALGAIAIATYGCIPLDIIQLRLDVRFLAARSALKANLPKECFRSIVGFENRPATTHRDIINLFDKTIAELVGVA